MNKPQEATVAPAWQVSQWFNVERPLGLEQLRGRVVVLHAFQMLCPGCVKHGIPQAERIHHLFPKEDVAVVGLHTVFEHHAVMTPEALQAFLHEYRITYPVGVDQPASNSPIPMTMMAYGMRGTPTLALIDRLGFLRLQHFGPMEDLAVGAEVMRLVAE